MSMNTASQSWAFLSTPSARRATTPIRTACTCGRISIHALREEGDSCLCRLVWRLEISIHALREEGDGGIGPHPGEIEVISIHALREEGDSSARARLTGALDFYPRPPRGGRFLRISVDIRPSTFLSTPSARRATVAPDPDNFSAGQFLSTPSARRATIRYSPPRAFLIFLSTPSARRATVGCIQRDMDVGISIHALREEGDAEQHRPELPQCTFLSTPSARRATWVGE